MAEVAGEVKLLLTVDGSSWSQAIDNAQKQLDSLKGKTKEAATVTRAEMTEARGSIALLGEQIGVHLPRHLQTFIAKLPGVAEAMSAAFSSVAIIGIGLAIIETGKKVAEFIEKTKKAAEEAQRATDKLVEGRHTANLELAASNARLEEEIAKLEKKPGDGLKLALAEARVEADKLARSLGSDVEQLQKLIDKQLGANVLQRVFEGQAGSAGTADQVDEYGKKIKELAHIDDPATRANEIKKYTGVVLDNLHEEITARERLQYLLTHNQDRTDAEAREAAALQKRFATGAGSQVDQTSALRAVAAFHDMVQEQYDTANETSEEIGLRHKRDIDQAAKDRADQAKEAAEALKRQTAERMTLYETELANQKAAHQMSLDDERAFWEKRKMIGVNLGDPINDLISRRIAPLNQEILKEQAKDAKDFLKVIDEMRIESGKATLADDPFKENREQQKQQSGTEAARAAALHERPELLRQIAAAQEELNDSEQVSRGAMASSTAEMIKQANVIARLQNELEELQGKREAAAAMPVSVYTAAFNPQVIDNQIRAKQAELAAAKQTLTYDTERDTFGSQMRDMFNEWTNRATELREAMSQMFDSTLSSINNAILKTMIDPYHRGDWKAAGRSIFGGAAGMGLQTAEGSIMKALGFGNQPRGSKENPMYTRSADFAPAAAGGAVNSLLSATSQSAASTSGSAIAKILGVAVSSIPYLATGGSLEAGMPAFVGERGTELFIPSTSGRIVPNDRLGGTSHTWNIDARHAQDPAAVRLAVQRGILEAAPHIAAGSIAASRDLQSRRPRMAP